MSDRGLPPDHHWPPPLPDLRRRLSAAVTHIYATPELTLPSSSAGYASGASSGCDQQPPQVYHLSRAAPAPGTAKKDELKQPIPEIYLTRLISTKGEGWRDSGATTAMGL